MTKLYENIKAISSPKGISIMSLERETNAPKDSISKWGKNKPHIYKVARVAEVLDVPIETLLEGIDIWEKGNR